MLGDGLNMHIGRGMTMAVDKTIQEIIDKYFNEKLKSPFSLDELLDSDELADKIAAVGDEAFELAGMPQELSSRAANWRKCVEVMIWKRGYHARRAAHFEPILKTPPKTCTIIEIQ
jgi:hypothetical protein